MAQQDFETFSLMKSKHKFPKLEDVLTLVAARYFKIAMFYPKERTVIYMFIYVQLYTYYYKNVHSKMHSMATRDCMNPTKTHCLIFLLYVQALFNCGLMLYIAFISMHCATRE